MIYLWLICHCHCYLCWTIIIFFCILNNMSAYFILLAIFFEQQTLGILILLILFFFNSNSNNLLERLSIKYFLVNSSVNFLLDFLMCLCISFKAFLSLKFSSSWLVLINLGSRSFYIACCHRISQLMSTCVASLYL